MSRICHFCLMHRETRSGYYCVCLWFISSNMITISATIYGHYTESTQKVCIPAALSLHRKYTASMQHCCVLFVQKVYSKCASLLRNTYTESIQQPNLNFWTRSIHTESTQLCCVLYDEWTGTNILRFCMYAESVQHKYTASTQQTIQH